MPARRVVPAETRSTCVQTLYLLLHKDTDTERGVAPGPPANNASSGG